MCYNQIETKKYDTSRLGNEDVVKVFNITLRNRYQALDENELENDNSEVARDFEVLQKLQSLSWVSPGRTKNPG